jgi:RNA 2',3'-cyclic 3'-phosphodiesterase
MPQHHSIAMPADLNDSAEKPRSRRLFVSLPIPNETEVALVGIQEKLRRSLRDATVSWTRPAQMHITVRFLGQVEEANLNPLAAALRDCLVGADAFPLACSGLGSFPDSRRPAILWAGVSDPDLRLAGLSRRITAATAHCTRQPAEDRFVSHVTLGRIRRLSRADLEAMETILHQGSDASFGRWQADEVQLMESNSGAGGVHYTVLHSVRLGVKQDAPARD